MNPDDLTTARASLAHARLTPTEPEIAGLARSLPGLRLALAALHDVFPGHSDTVPVLHRRPGTRDTDRRDRP
ncbi:hypothetical protein [Pseudonocardia spinosispora]|uniref:hypothetical protein n=1 Tax=Pseudonocardia spinosispora TaxID=103441 RepID=UPI000420B16C|nr:hypothetical protein [Pseudonocardia spinosispora]